MNYIKAALAVILGVLATFCQQYGVIISLVAIAIVFDVVTGLIRAKIQGNVSSKKGYAGFWKKIATLAGLFFGIFLDYFVPIAVSAGIAFDIPFALPFGLIVGIYIILNECVSICENLYQSGFTVPGFIVKMLKLAGEQIVVEKDEEGKRI